MPQKLIHTAFFPRKGNECATKSHLFYTLLTAFAPPFNIGFQNLDYNGIRKRLTVPVVTIGADLSGRHGIVSMPDASC
jgi:hypothetical protein